MVKKLTFLPCLIITFVVVDILAQVYPDTIFMPVTYYDFRSDGSNPEFECHIGGLRHGMVDVNLDADQKPVVGSTLFQNQYIKYWYRDWNDSAYKDYTVPVYNGSGIYQGKNTLGHTNTYKNHVISDSLPFIHKGNGLYEYRDDSFFPLDGKGFGYEGQDHNFAFTMELHTTFIMKPGLTFKFRGDDDVWAFINNKLVMDIGGIHGATDGSFLTDTISGLNVGQEYPFSFFFAERHTSESHIWITSNIVSTHIVTEVTIEAVPADASIPAGDSVQYTGTVWYDSTGADNVTHHLPDLTLSQQINWSFVSNNPGSNPANSSLSNSVGRQTVFTSTEAFETFTITAAYQDPYTNQITSAQMSVSIIAGPPNHLVVEATSDTSLSLDIKQNDQPMDTLTISASETSDNAYAMLRDQYGNFVNYSKNTTWKILSGSVLASAANVDSNTAYGEGVMTKNGPSGTGMVSAKDLDNSGLTYTDSFYVNVLNDHPVAHNDYYSVAEDNNLSVPSADFEGVLFNDTDPGGSSALTAEVVTDVTVGDLYFNQDGSFTYVPQPNYSGNVVFTYKAFDGEFYSNIATVTISIGSVIDPPVAINDTFTVNEDVSLNVSAPGVLSNDTAFEGGGLSANLIQDIDPSQGSLNFHSNGSFLYTPASNYHGTVTFTYQVNDGNSNSNVATVYINVISQNDAPIAYNNNYSVNEDATLSISPSGVLGNDYDYDDDALTAVLVSDVSHGTLNLNSNGSFTFTPDANYNGSDNFTYKVWDGSLYSNTATVSITINPVNDRPVANQDQYNAFEDVTLNVSAGNGVLSNDSDIEGSSLTAVLVGDIDASEGNLTFNSDGSFEYNPASDFNGTVTFTYQAFDGSDYSFSGTVMIFVAPVNDAPVANNDVYSTKQDSNLVVNAANGVIANDYDIDGDDLEASVVKGIGVDTGTISLQSDGSFTYDPHPAFVGNFTFTYNLSDDSTTSNTAIVTIYVGDVNEPPDAVNDTFDITEDNTLNISASGVLSNDRDPESDPLQAIKISNISTSEGSLTFNSNGSFEYIPASNFNGTVTFNYQANDSKLNSNIATVYINVTAVNDAPVANSDNYVTDEDIVLNIPTATIPGLLYNDADIENDALSVTLDNAMDASEGSISLNSSGSFTFTPAANFNGVTSFTYLVYDGNAYSNTGTVTITVNSVNDQPVVSDIPDQSINKGSSFQQISLDNYVTDADHALSKITWTVSGESKVDISIDPETHIATISVLDSNWHGSESIVFTATDPSGAYTSNTVTFTVNSLPMLPMPVADKSSGQYGGHNINVNLSVPGYANASIYYNYTTDGTTPPDPKTGTPQKIDGSGTIAIPDQAGDSSLIKITAYSSQYPYENSENITFEYTLIFPQLPAPIATPSAGDYDTSGLGVALSVPNHPDAQIFYTLDGTDPSTSGTKFIYTSGNPIILGPYGKVTVATIRTYATKPYYKPGNADFEYSFNPQKLPKPVADPPGMRFHSKILPVRLYVPNQTDAVIRYTLDGSTPNLNSDLYTDTLKLNKNTTIKAIAVKDNMIGPVMTEVYIQSLPTSIKFYSDMDATTPYSSTISCNAGTPIPVIAKIFDQYDICLTKHATVTAPISWELQEITGNQTGTINSATGYKTVFNPMKAYNTVKLIATFNNDGFVFSKEIELIIEPGDPYKLWLESDYDRLVSPNKSNPVDSIKLSSNKTIEKVYGIIRDSLGNWVSTSKSTDWQPAVHSIATVVSGLKNIGEGVIYKGLNTGMVTVTAENTNTDFSLKYPTASVYVTVLSYWYDSLKIVLNDTIANSVDSIVMNTNLDTVLYVFGFRDDGYGWEKVSANWSILNKSLKYNIANPPASTHEYLLSPVDTASGLIKVSLDDDNVTIPDSVFVKFIPGPPVRVEFTLLTPNDSLFAGETLTTEIRLYNGDNNLVYGTWHYPGDGDSVMYNNILDDGGRPDPYFLVDGRSYILKNQGTNAKETFVDGIDTAGFVLFYAPYDQDSLHQLSITLDQSITDNTRPFRLLPGKLANIDIAIDSTTPDTLVMHYSKGHIITTIGSDSYGNKISLVECNWKTTGDIPEIKYPDSTKQIYYEIEDVIYITTGYIIANNIDDPTIVDSVYVIIGPKPAGILEAVTQDLTGNGYLDAIKIVFDKKVLFNENVFTDNLISLTYTGNSSDIDFDINDITPLSAPSLNESDSIFTLTFDEYTIDKEPQTDWLPHISITGMSDIESVQNKQCTDGAPPVVWAVEKKKDKSGEIKKDKVYVTLSESFNALDGSVFMPAAVKPKAVFHVWSKSGNNFELESDILEGIEFFSEQDGKTLMFNTSNGSVINANHYFSLTYQESPLADVAKNIPAENNQKVRVRVSGKIEKLTIGPNPIIPTLEFWEHEKNLPLTHVDPKVAYNKVKTYGGGIVVVDIDFSGQELTQASAQLMVFDATGNLVHVKENRGNIIPTDWNLIDPDQNETRQLIFYWDGISDRGMMVAPGVYKAVVYIQFGRDTKKISGTMGVGR